MKLKRPEPFWTKEGTKAYTWHEMDSFLLQVAEKLEEARRLRLKALLGARNFEEWDKGMEQADAIEEKVIKALRVERR